MIMMLIIIRNNNDKTLLHRRGIQAVGDAPLTGLLISPRSRESRPFFRATCTLKELSQVLQTVFDVINYNYHTSYFITCVLLVSNYIVLRS